MANEQIPAGWYPDPAGDVTKIRYWDGQSWTEQTQDAQNPELQGNYNVPITPQPVYSQGQQNPMYGGGAPAPAGTDRKGFAIAALVIGILALLSWCTTWPAILLGALGIVFGVLGVKSSKKGMAIAGIVCGIIGLIIGLIWFFFVFSMAPDIIANPENYGLTQEYIDSLGL